MKLRRKLLRFLKANPRKHNQGAWCGTAQCAAGWACALDGWEHNLVAMEVASAFCQWSDYERDGAVSKDGTVAHAEQVARAILELTDREASDLFYSTSREETYRVLGALCR